VTAREVVVFVEGISDSADQARIRAVPGITVEFFADHQALEDRVDEAQVVAGWLSPGALARAARLEWLQSWAAGPDRALYPEMITSPVVLTSAKGNGAIPLAEHAIWLMLTLNRGATRWIDAQSDHRWDHVEHAELNGLTCGIIGLGNSGQDLARKAKAFHMTVIGMRRSCFPTANVDELYEPERLHDFLGRSDIVVVTAPLTNETAGMLGEAEFRAMKKTALFIVVSRGGIADDHALLRALSEGWIAGAGLDSFSHEPLPADSPFWGAPNTISTPHNGATTRATWKRGTDIFVDNLRRFVKGEPLVNVVDKQAGY
jgi:phosphoglycerate dehydrogenase-like enzyme